MGRGSTQILIRKIVECLAKSPKSITEIADETTLDRTAIVKYLNILKKSGLLIEEQQGTSKIFTIVPTYRTDTYFGLPLDSESERKFKSLYFLIKKNWQEQTSKQLLRTHAQKIAYKVITQTNLKIPFGWYIYGGIGVFSYDNSLDYNYTGLPKEVEDCVKEVTAEYAKNNHAWQSKKQQYEEAGNELYTLKEEIFSILYGPKFSSQTIKNIKDSLFILVKKIRRLISLAPKDKRTNYSEILESYQDLMMDITNKSEEELLLERKRDIIVLFESIWKYIALFNFKNDLKDYYSEKVLDLHFQLDILQQEDDIIEIGTDLQILIPEDEITDPVEKELKEALDKIEIRTPENQKLEKEKLEKLKKELGLEKFNEYLFKQAGLD